MTAPAGVPSRATILVALRELYKGPAWHGPSVLASLRGVDAELASRRPAPGRNTIWELVLHLTHARYLLMRRLDAEPIARFPRKLRKAWWPIAANDSDESAWRSGVELLDTYQNLLIASVERAPAARFTRVRAGQRRTIAHELLGNAFHDAYHAGQIVLLHALFKADSR